jgi:hypothetical protein
MGVTALPPPALERYDRINGIKEIKGITAAGRKRLYGGIPSLVGARHPQEVIMVKGLSIGGIFPLVAFS